MGRPHWPAASCGHPRSEGDHEFRRGHTELDRAWAAFDGTSVVGTLRSFPTPLTLPGGATVTSAALTAVTVTATHRRQGLLTRMITGDLDASVDKDEPVGILIAAEFPIYGRFGYGSAADHNVLKLDVSRTTWTREVGGHGRAGRRGDGSTRGAAGLRAVPRDAARCDRTQTTAGGTSRLRILPFPAFPISEKFWVLCRDRRGKVVGYVSYTIDDHWVESSPREHGRRSASSSVSTRKPPCGSGSTSRRSTGFARSARTTDRSTTRCTGSSSTDGPLRGARAHRLPLGASARRARAACRRAAIRSSSGLSSRWSTTWATRTAGSRSTVGPTARRARRLAPGPTSRCRLPLSVRCPSAERHCRPSPAPVRSTSTRPAR